MAIPSTFPYVVANGANPSLGYDIIGKTDVLEYSSTIRHIVAPDFNALVLVAYISLDSGATWTPCATGPAISSSTSLVYQVASFTTDQANKIIYGIYFSAAQTIAIVPFNATATGGSFGSADDSGIGYDSGTTGNANESIAILLGQYRAGDDSVWVAFEAGQTTGVIPLILQTVRAMKYTVGSGWDAPSAISTSPTATNESSLGAVGIDPTTGTVYFAIVDVHRGAPADSNVRMVSIDSSDTISAPDLVDHSGTGVLIFVSPNIGVDATSGNLMFWYRFSFSSGDSKIAFGKMGSWSVSAPSFLQPSTGHFIGFCAAVFFASLWNLFFDDAQSTKDEYSCVTSADGSTWGTPVIYGTEENSDLLWENLDQFQPVVFSDRIVGSIVIQPGNISGVAFWGFGSSPPPSPTKRKFFPRFWKSPNRRAA